MTVTSTQQSAYVYEANSVNKTNSTSQVSSSSSSTGEVNKLEQMKEKYKDVYTPIPETYSKADEDLQTQNIYEAYPNYIDFKDFLKIVDTYLEGPKAQLGQELTLAEQENQKQDYNQAYEKAYELFGGKEAFIEMQKDAQNIKKEHPVNNWAKDGLDNAAEMSRFYNAGIYEGLESGMSLEDAKKTTSNAIFNYMGTSNNKTTLRAMPNSELGIKGSELFNEFVKYEKEQYSYDNNIDLREYSIEGWWRDNDIYKSDNSMISEIQKKLSQFNFMLDNPDAIQTALDKLDPNSRPEVSALHKIIKENELPEAQLALKIFDNYKIYNSLNVMG